MENQKVDRSPLATGDGIKAYSRKSKRSNEVYPGESASVRNITRYRSKEASSIEHGAETPSRQLYPTETGV